MQTPVSGRRLPLPKNSSRQVAALPIRTTDAGVEIMLVTSRETGRWVSPKGWPIKDVPDHKAAAMEAMEEAGCKGKMGKRTIGSYKYFKRMSAHFELLSVDVYLLQVRHMADDWKEAHERQRRWFRPDDAASLVMEPGLTALIQGIAKVPRAK